MRAFTENKIPRARESAPVPLSAGQTMLCTPLFENPTVADLAVKIADAQAQKVVPKDVEDVLADLESLSEEEADRLLAQENSKRI